MSRWLWILKQAVRRLWLRASLIGALGIAAAVLAAVAERYIPWKLPIDVGADAVDGILNIIASSMLAVTTFSLSVMTSAYGAATTNVSPRATKLLIEDRVTQNVLSTFIGSFLFSIVGIVVLRTGAYGERGRAILFFVTIAVIGLVVISLLRWIDYLTRFGRLGETTQRVEEATRQAIEARLANPHLGGTPLRDPERAPPEGAMLVTGSAIGYVQHIDMGALSRCSEELDASIFVGVLPGTFVYADTKLAWIGKPVDEEACQDTWETIIAAFAIGETRSFDQDPRFGLAVLSEIAQRALSPAINDPGTAIDVIGRSTRLLSAWAQGSGPASDEKPPYPGVHVPSLATHDLFEDAFMALARDGAGMIEVQLRLFKALSALSYMEDPETKAAAQHQAELAYARAETALTLPQDRQRLQDVMASLAGH